MRHPILTATAAMLLVSCSGDATPPPLVTYRMEMVSGSNQTDTAAAILAEPLVVRVYESTGRAAATRPVDFAATAGSGSVSAASVATDAQGFAQVRWTLGTNEGTESVRATLRGSADSVLTFLGTVRSPTLRAATLSAGYEHTCAVTTSHRLYCWGKNDEGQLGDGTVAGRNFAGALPGTLLFDRVATGRGHTCAVTIAGELYCWGRNFWGQIGDGSTTTRLTPVRVAPNLAFADVVAGGENTCGLTVAGAVYCWGFMLGSQSTNDSKLPADVSGGTRFRSLSAAEYLVCGIGVDDKPYCLTPTWVVDRLAWRPQPAPSPTRTRFAGGLEFMCGLDVAGAAWCWGTNRFGQLGTGTTAEATGVVDVSGGHAFVGLYSGYDWTCGVTPTGQTYCWGHNLWGAVAPVVGQRSVEPTPLFLDSPSGMMFLAMDGGFYHMCGIGADTQVYCWGGGFNGQLGDGHSTENYYNRPTPAPVIRR
jgi:alpha-tubulin suppressor-like RCC1 family protein